MEYVGPALAISGVVIVVGGIIFAVWFFEKKRTEAWQEAAQNLGYQFIGKTSPAHLPNIGRFKAFSKGRRQKAKNVIRGQEGDSQVTLVDFQYVTGYGKNQTTHKMTICLLESPSFNVTHCFLRPQIRFFDLLGKLFGGQDINFEEDPDFSKGYVLQGEREDLVHDLFNANVREFFVQNRKKAWQFEATGNTLCFHNNRRIKPAMAQETVADALEIMSLLRNAS